MIAKDNLPMNSTEKEGFKYVFHTAVPLYKIPGRKAISKLIYEKYDVLSEQVKDKLKRLNQLLSPQMSGLKPCPQQDFSVLRCTFYFKKN